jgi:hypothetical protein
MSQLLSLFGGSIYSLIDGNTNNSKLRGKPKKQIAQLSVSVDVMVVVFVVTFCFSCRCIIRRCFVVNVDDDDAAVVDFSTSLPCNALLYK